MEELAGKTALISGGAEGLGLGIARVLGRHGMNIVLADINPEQLQQAEKELRDLDIPALAVALDVADLTQWQRIAEEALASFGGIHMLVNNAGVSGSPAGIEDTHQEDWRWILDVNLMGVINGAQVIVPLIKQHGEGGWLINVASMAGFGGLPGATPYSATKAAVVAISECWHAELQPHNIQVSTLCPGFTKTRINKSHRNRPGHYDTGKRESNAQASELSEYMQAIIDDGMATDLVAERMVEAIAAGELYIFSHPNYRPQVKARFKAIDGAFERAASSELLPEHVVPDIPVLG